MKTNKSIIPTGVSWIDAPCAGVPVGKLTLALWSTTPEEMSQIWTKTHSEFEQLKKELGKRGICVATMPVSTIQNNPENLSKQRRTIAREKQPMIFFIFGEENELQQLLPEFSAAAHILVHHSSRGNLLLKSEL